MTSIFSKIKQQTQWLLTGASIWSMVLLPVAEGKAAQAQNITRADMQAALVGLGLNKSMTLGQFFEKNKALFPERVQKQLGSFIRDNANYPMPQFELTSAKNSEGAQVPTLRVSQNGQLVNIQMLGGQDTYAKFNSTSLSMVDVINFKDMFVKLNNGDANLRRQVGQINANAVSESRSFQNFRGFPAITLTVWNQMNLRERASYIQQMRLMYLDALKVNAAFTKNPTKKNSYYKHLENIFKILFEDSSAEQTRQLKVGAAKKSTKVDSRYNGNCVVAGYISTYEDGIENNSGANRRACSVEKAIERYKSSSEKWVTEAINSCVGTNTVACNPILYGFDRGTGNTICIPKTSAEFQQATHFDQAGGCDARSRLTSDAIKSNTQFDKNKPYDTSDDRHAQEKNNVLADPENLAHTEAFVEGILKKQGNGLADLLKAKQLSQAQFDQLQKEINGISSLFNKEISDAINSCENQINTKLSSGAKVPDEQKLACDQLHRRYLNSEKLIEVLKGKIKPNDPPNPPPVAGKSCPTGMTNGATGEECHCSNGNPGTWTKDQAQSLDVNKECKIAGGGKPSEGGDQKPPADECKDGQRITGPNGAKTDCIPNAGKPTKPGGKDDSGWFGNFFKKAMPWLVGGLALFAMYKWMAPKKPALNPAGDKCPNGTTPPCVQVCQSPQVYINGACMCAPCAPGQTMTDANNCTCSSGGGTTPTDVICPDGATRAATLALCPATQYTCWDGSKVTNPMNCPEKPATSGGTGTTSKPTDTGR